MTSEQFDSTFSSLMEAYRLRTEKREAEEEDSRFFNLPSAWADFAHWVKMAFWTAEDGLALSLGRDPDKVSWETIQKGQRDHALLCSPFVAKYRRGRQLVKRAVAAGALANSAPPGVFVEWAKANLEFVHPALIAEIEKRRDVVAAAKVRPTSQQAEIQLQQPVETLKMESKAEAHKDLDPRERKSLLRIIRALVEMNNLPDRAPAPSIEKQLESLGFTSPRQKAIHRVITEARALEPDKDV